MSRLKKGIWEEITISLHTEKKLSILSAYLLRLCFFGICMRKVRMGRGVWVKNSLKVIKRAI